MVYTDQALISLKVMIHLSTVSEVSFNLAPEILTAVMAFRGG